MCTRVPERAGRWLDDPGLVPRQEEPAQDSGRAGNDKVQPEISAK